MRYQISFLHRLLDTVASYYLHIELIKFFPLDLIELN